MLLYAGEENYDAKAFGGAVICKFDLPNCGEDHWVEVV